MIAPSAREAKPRSKLGPPLQPVRSFELPVFVSLLTLGTASPLSEVPVTLPADVKMEAPVVVVGE